MAQPDARADKAADVARGADKSLEGLLPLLGRTQDADRYARVAQIGTHFHFGHRGEANARILDFLGDDRAYLVLQLLGQPLRTMCHKPVRSRGWRIEDRKYIIFDLQSSILHLLPSILYPRFPIPIPISSARPSR